MGTLQKLQNSIQTLFIFWPVYPIHTNSLFQVIFIQLPFCHFPPPNTSIRGKESKIQLIFHLNILVFQTNGKHSYSFPVLTRFCNGLLVHAFSCALSSYGALGKFGEHSRSQSCPRLSPRATLTLLSSSPNFPRALYLDSAH